MGSKPTIIIYLVYGLCSTAGGAILAYLWGSPTPNWVRLTATGAFAVGLGVGLVSFYFYRSNQDERLTAETGKRFAAERELERKSLVTSNAEAVAVHKMSKDALDELADILLDKVVYTRDANERAEAAGHARWAAELLNGETGESRVRGELLRRMLHRINGLFANDIRAIDTTRIHDDFFKAAYFEVGRPDGYDHDVLHRICHVYPAGMEPSYASDILDPADPKTGHAVAIRAWEGERMRAITNVKESSDWVDLWEGQRERYESMLCVPVAVRPRHEQWKSKVYGVLVIDTNRRGYFTADRSSLALYSTLLSPFCRLIALLHELEDRHQRFLSLPELS